MSFHTKINKIIHNHPLKKRNHVHVKKNENDCNDLLLMTKINFDFKMHLHFGERKWWLFSFSLQIQDLLG